MPYADQAITTEEENPAEQLMVATSCNGAHPIFDLLACPLLEKLAQAAAHGATLLE